MSSIRQRGMGLVELLVWMAISLLIISVIGVVYGNTKQLTRVNDTVSRLQENGRFVVYLLDRDIRMVGFRGCNSNDTAVPYLSVLNSTAYPYQFNVAIAGYRGASGTWSPALPTDISALTPAPLAGTDVVTVRFIDGTGVSLTAAMANSRDDIQVAAGSALATGDVLLVADCSAIAIFNASDFNLGSGKIKHDTGGAILPGNTTKDLGSVFHTDAAVYRLVTRTYYVAPSVRKPGTNALWANSVPGYDGLPQPEEMVEGVEGLVLSFGEDLDGDKAANRYVTANAVGTWSNVVSVKAQLLLASVRDNMATAPQAYTFNGVTTTPTDRRLRSVLSSVITVRNRVP
ncbi:MAG TPA: PilW family protein [Casimicrobiaceae bacterium]|nr:PilW family protein [Casimicrobiaceae bacterium]